MQQTEVMCWDWYRFFLFYVSGRTVSTDFLFVRDFVHVYV